LLVTVLIAAILLGMVSISMAVIDLNFSLRTDWPWMLPGLFAQGGVAEESLFRGYVFNHLRRHRPFQTAALLSCIPFTLVHSLMFLTVPWPIAAASMCLALLTAFPLAHLFERGGNTVWAPALLHTVIEGAPKIVETSSYLFPLMWICACAVLPYLAFALLRAGDSGNSHTKLIQPE
jgi:membrane protease YdiL (CAAX protease family)